MNYVFVKIDHICITDYLSEKASFLNLVRIEICATFRQTSQQTLHVLLAAIKAQNSAK